MLSRIGLQFLIGKRRRAAFLAAAAVLALGVGANAAMFAILRTMLISPLPYRASESIVQVTKQSPGALSQSLSIAEFRAAEGLGDLFEAGTGCALDMESMRSGDRPENAAVARVSGAFFGVFAARPLLGTVIGDAPSSGEPVAVISESVSRSQFGGIDNPVGRLVTIGGRRYSVIGVMSEGFDPPCGPVPATVWVPEYAVGPGQGAVLMFARLRSGVSPEAATAGLNSRLQEQLSAVGGKLPTFRVQSLRDVVTTSSREAMEVVQYLFLALLIVTAGTVAHLLVVAFTSRAPEFTIRLALGATPKRLLSLMCWEALSVALVGTIAAIPIAIIALQLIRVYGPPIPGGTSIMLPEALVSGLVSTLIIIGAVAIAFFSLDTSNLDATLRERTTRSIGKTHRRFLRTVIAVEIALATTLMTFALLFLRDLQSIERLQLGFSGTDLVVADVSAPKIAKTAADHLAFVATFRDEITKTFGESAIAFGNGMPFSSFRATTQWTVRDANGNVIKRCPADVRSVSGNYFSLLGIPVLAGKTLGNATANELPSAVINEEFAKKCLAGRSWEGLSLEKPVQGTFRIKGVVGNVRMQRQSRSPAMAAYLPLEVTPTFQVSVAIRGTDVEKTAQAVRTVLAGIDPDLAPNDVVLIGQQVHKRENLRRFYVGTLSVAAFLTLILAFGGTHAVVDKTVKVQRHDLLIRMAIGARPWHIISHLTRDVAVSVLIGAGTGMAAAWFGAALWKTRNPLAMQLDQVDARDSFSFVAAQLLIVSVICVAALWPAWRGSRPTYERLSS